MGVARGLAVLAAALLAVGAGGAAAARVDLAAPGHLDARVLPVVAPAVCWTGTVTFTPTAFSGGNQAYHKVLVTGQAGAFQDCIGQYADVSVNKAGAQIDFARLHKLVKTDHSSFEVQLDKGVLPKPVPAGTTYTLVIHP